jgi:hypothetical protein
MSYHVFETARRILTSNLCGENQRAALTPPLPVQFFIAISSQKLGSTPTVSNLRSCGTVVPLQQLHL